MTETIDPRINDEYTRVQMRLIEERLAAERMRQSEPKTPESSISIRGETLKSPTVKLQQSELRRKELLDRIKEEDRLTEKLKRPHSIGGHESPDLPATPPSRMSLHGPHDVREKRPEFHKPRPAFADHRPHFYEGTEIYPRQVIEHQIRPARLDPLDYPPPRPSTGPQILPVPQPYIINAGDGRQHHPLPPPHPTSAKQEMMEMMLLQNAQMHQVFMNQMMMSTLPKPPPPPPAPLQQQPAFQQLLPAAQSGGRQVTVSLEDIMALKSPRRPPSVHHHHYDDRNRGDPSFNGRPNQLERYPHMNGYPSPRQYPTQVAPLKQPVSKPKPVKKKKKPPPAIKWEVFRPKDPPPPSPKKKFVYGDLPFPGPLPLRRFRHAAYAVFFSRLLKKAITSPNFKKPAPFSDDLLFGIKLKEAVAALHTHYLNPTKKMRRVLDSLVAENTKDLTAALHPDHTNQARVDATADLAFMMENLCFEMTEIMPQEGVLGTHRKSVVYDMLKSGKLYPSGYLWDIERELLRFDVGGRTIEIDDSASFSILCGCFIGKALVNTILLKPVEFGFLKQRPNFNAEKNLRLVASLFVYLLRRLYSKTPEPVHIPHEISRFLYSDIDIADLVKRLKTSFDYAIKLFSEWGREYLKRLHKVRELEEGKLYK